MPQSQAPAPLGGPTRRTGTPNTDGVQRCLWLDDVTPTLVFGVLHSCPPQAEFVYLCSKRTAPEQFR
jgi:hypothetical protein